MSSDSSQRARLHFSSVRRAGPVVHQHQRYVHYDAASVPRERAQQEIMARIERPLTGEAAELDIAFPRDAESFADIVTLQQQLTIEGRVE